MWNFFRSPLASSRGLDSVLALVPVEVLSVLFVQNRWQLTQYRILQSILF
jgi:hypothetical protein